MIEYDVLDWPKGNEDVKTYYVHYVEGLEATAARRLELLRRVELDMTWCPVCKREVVRKINNKYFLSHADDCELAEELADENH